MKKIIILSLLFVPTLTFAAFNYSPQRALFSEAITASGGVRFEVDSANKIFQSGTGVAIETSGGHVSLATGGSDAVSLSADAITQAGRVISFPDKTGTIALLDDITAGSFTTTTFSVQGVVLSKTAYIIATSSNPILEISGSDDTITFKGIGVAAITAGNNITISSSSGNVTINAAAAAGDGVGATTTINGIVGDTSASGVAAITFATGTDTNIKLTIVTSTDQLTFTPVWEGTLADGRIASAATWNAKQSNLTWPIPYGSSTHIASFISSTVAGSGIQTNTLLGASTIWLAATFTETPGQVHIASSSGAWTFSAPQYLWTTSTVAFAGVTSTNFSFTNATGTNVAVTSLTPGNCLQASAGGLITDTGSACGSGGGISLLHGTDGPTVTMSTSTFGAGNLRIRVTTSTDNINYQPVWGFTPTDGQLLIGNGTDFDIKTLTAGNGINIGNSSGTININHALTFTGTANQITVASTSPTWTFSLPSSIFLLNGVTSTNISAPGTLRMPNGASPVFSLAGEIALDTTDNQFLVSTGTSELVYPSMHRLWGGTIASSSADFVNGGRIWLPPQRDGFTVREIHCAVDGGTSVVINLSNSAGTSDSETVTCTATVATDLDITSNPTYTAGGLQSIEIGAITGSVDYVTFSIWGRYTRE